MYTTKVTSKIITTVEYKTIERCLASIYYAFNFLDTNGCRNEY